MATGLARGARARGKIIAFGDGKRLLWDKLSPAIFSGNKNICFPGHEKSAATEWVAFHRGNRIYNKDGGNRWIWNYDFRPVRGEVIFSLHEQSFARQVAQHRFVVIEPNVPQWKGCAPNKDWPAERYEEVAARLTQAGYFVLQLHHGGRVRLKNAHTLPCPQFRHALAVMEKADLYIGPEGGLHHGAAAVDIPAVVLFGGFVPPEVLGYDGHTNLVGNSEEACGSFTRCSHCVAAMRSIEVEEVVEAALTHLQRRAA